MNTDSAKPDGKLIRHSALLLVTTGVANIANVAFHMLMGRSLTGDEYSILAAMLNMLLVVATPLDALRNAMAHFAARAHRAGEPALARAIARRWCGRVILLAIPAMLALWLLHRQLATFFHLQAPGPILLVIYFLPAFMLLPVLAGVLQGLQRFWWFAAALHGPGPVRLALGWGLILCLARTAHVAVLSHALAILYGVLVAAWGVWWVTRTAGTRVPATRGIGPYFLKAMYLLAGYGLLMNCDVILVRHFHPEQAGEFAWAATIGRSVVFLPMPIAMALFPKVVTAGGTTRHSRVLVLQALGMVVAMIGAGVAVSVIWPWLPLRILYGVTSASPELLHLVRMVMLAMSPLGITYLLLHFEMAQHRFETVPWLLAVAAAYLGGAAVWHHSVLALVAVLGTVATLSAVLYLWVVLRPGRTRGGSEPV